MPKVKCRLPDGAVRSFEAPVGASVMEAAKAAGIALEAACEGSLACATCHVIVDDRDFSRLPPASEDEELTLDTLPAVARTSRLSCQIRMTEQLDGLTFSLAS